MPILRSQEALCLCWAEMQSALGKQAPARFPQSDLVHRPRFSPSQQEPVANAALLPSLATTTSETPAKGLMSLVLRCDSFPIPELQVQEGKPFVGSCVVSGSARGQRANHRARSATLMQGLLDLPTGLWKHGLPSQLSQRKPLLVHRPAIVAPPPSCSLLYNPILNSQMLRGPQDRIWIMLLPLTCWVGNTQRAVGVIGLRSARPC